MTMLTFRIELVSGSTMLCPITEVLDNPTSTEIFSNVKNNTLLNCVYQSGKSYILPCRVTCLNRDFS